MAAEGTSPIDLATATPMDFVQWTNPASTRNGIGAQNQMGSRAAMRYSSVFQPKGCFANVKEQANYDNLYCAGNTIVMVLSFVNIIIFTLLLVIHIKEKRRSESWSKVLLKVKTMVFTLIILLELSVFIRYTFVIESTATYDSILIISEFIESIILFQICYFYTKKAAHFLEDNKKIRKQMRRVMYFAVFTFLALAIFQYFDKSRVSNITSSLCHTVYFILPNCFNQVANGFFFYIGVKVMQTINEFNSHQTALISPEDNDGDDSQDNALKTSQKEIMFRKRAVWNMWVMILTIFFVDMYSTVYSFVLFIWADDDCFIQDVVWVRSLSTVVQRSIQFVWWLYPVMWLFWPGQLSCRKDTGAAQKKSRGRSRSKDETKSIGSADDEDDDASETDTYDRTSRTSYVGLQPTNAGSAMFGGPTDPTQTFMLLNNAAGSRTGFVPYTSTSHQSSDNDLSSHNSTSVYKRDGTFRVSTSPHNSINQVPKANKARGNDILGLVTTPTSDYSNDLERDF